MLTRKDFKAIAGMIERFVRHVYVYPEDAIEDFVGNMADYLATKNPAFDRERFINACK